MYAIVLDGGRQYRVIEGQQIDVDYREVADGSELTFDQVLAVSGEQGLTVGKPVIAGARVTAEVIGLAKGEKIYVQKFRRRKNYRRRTGHRQWYTRVRINKIQSA